MVRAVDANHNVGPVGTQNLGDGISISASNGNVVEMNTVAHNGPYSGISLVDSSNNNRILGNQVIDNNAETLCSNLAGYGTTTVPYGSPTTNVDFGVSLECPAATHNVIASNFITGSGSDGIDVSASCVPNGVNVFSVMACTLTTPNEYNLITNNVVDANGFAKPGHGGSGINLFAMGRTTGILMPTNNTIDHNTDGNNGGYGFEIGMGSSGNTFAFDSASGNTATMPTGSAPRTPGPTTASGHPARRAWVVKLSTSGAHV